MYQLSATETTEENYFLTTDLKEALYNASFEAPLTIIITWARLRQATAESDATNRVRFLYIYRA